MQEFQEALQVHSRQLVEDPVVHTHLSALYDTLLEQNLIRLIEPFSCVQINHLASLIKLPVDTVLSKLAQVSQQQSSGGMAALCYVNIALSLFSMFCVQCVLQ